MISNQFLVNSRKFIEEHARDCGGIGVNISLHFRYIILFKIFSHLASHVVYILTCMHLQNLVLILTVIHFQSSYITFLLLQDSAFIDTFFFFAFR